MQRKKNCHEHDNLLEFRGMSAPDSTERIPFSFRCPLPLYRRMKKQAAALQTNVSTFVCSALKHALGSPEDLEQAMAELELSQSSHNPALTHGTHSCRT